jgi:hypothetical protein
MLPPFALDQRSPALRADCTWIELGEIAVKMPCGNVLMSAHIRIWDEILADRMGRFAGFSSINERDLPAELAKLIRH